MFNDQYPYTNLHNINLDWILNRVKEWGALVLENDQKFKDLDEANAAFKEYVTSYITNLDVQAEIDDKLDRMLSSGVLTRYMEPYIVAATDEWLEDHITNPSSPPLDDTLTLVNAAAQAKAAGDRITAVNLIANANANILNGNVDVENLSDTIVDALQKVGIAAPLSYSDLFIPINSGTDPNRITTYEPISSDNSPTTVVDSAIKTPSGSGYRDVFFFGDTVEEVIITFSTGGQMQYHLVVSDWGGFAQYPNEHMLMVLQYTKTGTSARGYVRKSNEGSITYQGIASNNFSCPTAERVKITLKQNGIQFVFYAGDNEYTKLWTFDDLQVSAHKPTRLGIYYYKQFNDNVNSPYITARTDIATESEFAPAGEEEAGELFGMTYDAWGDSLTAGDINYADIIADRVQGTATRHAVAGDTLGMLLSRFNSYSGDFAEYITFFVGINDYADANPQTPISTFKANLETLLDNVITRAPTRKIGFITPLPTLKTPTGSQGITQKEYNDVILNVCKEKNVKCLNMFEEGGWYSLNTAFTALYYPSSTNLHPTGAGQALLADKVEKFLKTL